MTATIVNSAESLQRHIAALHRQWEQDKYLRITVKTGRSRSVEQNSRMWAMLADVSQQVDWYGSKLAPEEWKDVFTAALKRQKVVPGLDGGFVAIGTRTSEMTGAEMSELMELMAAFGAERSVQFHDEQ